MKKNYNPVMIFRSLLVLVLLGFAVKTMAAEKNNAPVIIVNPYNRTICESATTYFFIVATAVDSYLWQTSNDGGVSWTTATGGIYSGEATDTLKLAGAYLSAQYRCIVEGGGVKDTSTSASLNFFINEQTLTAASTQLCRDDSTTITMAASQTGINYYLRDGITTTGPFSGTGGPITFNTGAVYATKTFSVLAQKSAVGNALNFDGVDDFVTVYKGLSALNAFTFSMYIFPQDLTDGKLFSATGYDLAVANGGITFTTTSIGSISYNSISKDVWSHIAVAYDGANLHLYINGTEVNTVAATGTLSASTSFTLGKNNQAASSYFKGALDEFRMRDKCLSLAEIRESMTDCITGTESDVLAYYRFDDGVGSPILSDISGHGYYGSLTNMDNANSWILGTSGCGDNLACSKVFLQTVRITVSSVAPVVTANSNSRCDKGVVSLNASSTIGDISWYTALTGGTVVATGNSYVTPYLNGTTSYYVSANNQGCVSQRLEVKAIIKPMPDVTLTVNSPVVTANQAGATYQWIDCKRENTLIPGATTISYTVTETGDYAVWITLDGCADTSKCVPVTITGIESLTNANQLLVYPNPSNGAVNIRSTSGGTFVILNELGQTVQQILLTASNNYTAVIDNLNSGLYIIADISGGQPIKQKMVITK